MRIAAFRKRLIIKYIERISYNEFFFSLYKYNRMIKKIDNIQPFNELFFINCFYNSLFSIINYYQKSIIPFLSNSILVYSYNSNNEISFSVDFISKYNDKELLGKMGIIQQPKKDTNHLIQDIIISIDNNNPILLSVDCFYLPIRPEFYLKKHCRHALTVYGYDNHNLKFYIIEQKHFDSLTYAKTEINCKDLLNGFKGYIELAPQNLPYSEFELNNNKTINHINDSIYIYKENIINNYENIQNGLILMEKFISDYKKIFLNEFNLKQNCTTIIEGINKIINAKKAQNYMLNKLLHEVNHPLVKLSIEIENIWTFIRYKLAKYKFSTIYRQKDFIDLENKLIEILNNEINYLQNIKDL